MDNQRLRNLTTRRLHTCSEDMREDIGFLTGEQNLSTIQAAMLLDKLRPWLREQVTDDRFWNGELDLTHQGETAIEPMKKETL